MSMSVSMLKRSRRPRITSLTRGWATPRSLAVSACVSPRATITFCKLTMSSARTLRYSASSPEKPRSRNTFPLDRVRFTLSTGLTSSFPAPPLMQERAQALPREVEILSSRASCPLFERMQDIDGLGELRDIEHAMLAAGVNADLLHPGPNARHRLPIVRLEPALDPPELEPCNLSDVLAEGPDRVARVPEPRQRLDAHVPIYKYLDIGVNDAGKLATAFGAEFGIRGNVLLAPRTVHASRLRGGRTGTSKWCGELRTHFKTHSGPRLGLDRTL